MPALDMNVQYGAHITPLAIGALDLKPKWNIPWQSVRPYHLVIMTNFLLIRMQKVIMVDN